MLAVNLPAGSQTWIACKSDLAWTEAEHLGAALVDVVQIGNWQRAGDSKAPKPERLLRPSDQRKTAEKRSRTEERARAFAARHRGLVEPSEPSARPIRPRDARGRFAKAR